uniref:PABS domain-containing protein n=1 Tax=Steinernema glaseri TaxID=37863 RepID=A0A1I7YZQ9_9BILA
MRRRHRTVFRLILLVIPVFLIVHYLLGGPKRVPMKEGTVELDKLCSEVANDCYIVKQSVHRSQKVTRFLVSEKHSQNGYFTISSVPMKIDHTGNLAPDYSSLSFECINAMVVASYMTSSLRLNREGRVLSLGLGGGTLDMFLYSRQPLLDLTVVELDPTMEEVARKWFGAVEDARRRTVLGDGAEFVRLAAREGIKYDAIELDACNAAEELFRCPAEAFYDDETMRSMKEALTEGGVLVINLLSSNKSILYTKVKEHFPFCWMARMRTENEVVACAKKEPEEAVMEKFKEVSRALGLAARIGFVKFDRFTVPRTKIVEGDAQTKCMCTQRRIIDKGTNGSVFIDEER